MVYKKCYYPKDDTYYSYYYPVINSIVADEVDIKKDMKTI